MTNQLLRIEETIEEKKAGLQSIAEPWADTTTPAGRMVLTVFAGIAEFEPSLIAARTEEGVIGRFVPRITVTTKNDLHSMRWRFIKLLFFQR